MGVIVRERARATTRSIRTRLTRVAGLLAVAAAIPAALSYQSLVASTLSDASPVDVPRSEPRVLRGAPQGVPGQHGGALGAADGAVPDGTTVFDRDIPGVGNLDSDLRLALRRAATAAAPDGVVFLVDSGWRSSEYQERLLREAIAKYGSAAKAARWVATPDTSAHVSGDAVDLAPSRATTWLSKHGAKYGLCQIYRNEPWHYELRPEAIGGRCPAMYADPTRDPRMR